ncbi:MAG TPA: hypothetical protein VMX97_04735 [Hyphomicrobiaceae bacterium]|nr:hypothetical protein [Hyphomicrobiaceae bacterium]
MVELSERDATGEVAEIFAELRELWGVPYVSAIHRYLGAQPGFLEWAWGVVEPAFRSGEGQEAGWRCACGLSIGKIETIPGDALRIWGVDERGLEAIKVATDGFMRVAPVNMIFAGLVKALLEGHGPGGNTLAAKAWLPPAALPAPLPMINAGDLGSAERTILDSFATEMEGRLFVPGLYRILMHWPSFAAHLSVSLRPRLRSAESECAYAELRRRIDEAVPVILMRLPAKPIRHAAPGAAQRAKFFAVWETYRQTSPELVVAGRAIRDALPDHLG